MRLAATCAILKYMMISPRAALPCLRLASRAFAPCYFKSLKMLPYSDFAPYHLLAWHYLLMSQRKEKMIAEASVLAPSSDLLLFSRVLTLR